MTLPPRLALWLGVLAASGATAEIRIGPSEGLVYEDPDRELRLDLDGRFDPEVVIYDRRNERSSQARLDRGLLGGEGTWREGVAARAVFDLTGIDTRWGLWEAWISARHERVVRLTVGMVPLPLGVEDSIREGARSLPGLPGFAAFLSSRRDVAALLDGEIAEGLLSYELSAALGQGSDLLGNRRGDPQLAGRLVSYPLRFVDAEAELGPYSFPLVSGIFASFGMAWLLDYDAELDVATPLRNPLFQTGRLDGRGGRTWQLGYGVDFGPVRVVHELVRGSIFGLRLPTGERMDFDDQITAWQLVVAWRITGEPYDSRPFRQRDLRRPTPPRRPLDGVGADAGWGALELAVRYANADIDRRFQELGFIPRNPDAPPPENFASSQEFRALTLALSWDPTAYLRVSAEIVRVIADQYPAAFDSHGRDTSGRLRLQYAF